MIIGRELSLTSKDSTLGEARKNLKVLTGNKNPPTVQPVLQMSLLGIFYKVAHLPIHSGSIQGKYGGTHLRKYGHIR
jgi:hypothetical protein